MKKVLYISGGRQDYGPMRKALLLIKRDPNFRIEILATGMHFMPEFGKTITEIKKDNFKIHEIKTIYREDNKESMASFIGEFIVKATKEIKKIKPDFILICGDRPEILAGAIVGVYLTIPVVHVHGGDISSTVDELARHAITKLSHIHLAATKKSAERIKKMGEDFWRVFVVGAPGLDSILNKKLFSKKEIAKRYKLDLSKPILLIIQHPVTAEIKSAAGQMTETMESIKKIGHQALVIYPNADAGGRKMIKIIEKYRKYNFIRIYKSISHKDYLSLMGIADVLVGNSSGGIIEAPSFGLPAVNIGTRQEGRERAKNVIDVGYDKREIIAGIKKALFDKKFLRIVKRCRSPYGEGKAGEKILKVLKKIRIDKKLLQKRISY